MDDERTVRRDEQRGDAATRGTAGDSGVADLTQDDPIAADPTAADTAEEGGLISSTDLSGGGGDFGTAGTGADGTTGDSGRDTHGR